METSMMRCLNVKTLTIFTLLTIINLQQLTYADDEQNISRELAVRAIIGEASSQGYNGMLDVASGIRNRGTLNGVYGVNAKHIDSEPQWVWEMAKEAWDESIDNRTHNGDCWGSLIVDKPWINTMDASDSYQRVFTRKDHVFYKEVKPWEK